MLEAHQQADPKGRKSRQRVATEGGIVGTDQKSMQGLCFHGRQPGMGTLLP